MCVCLGQRRDGRIKCNIWQSLAVYDTCTARSRSIWTMKQCLVILPIYATSVDMKYNNQSVIDSWFSDLNVYFFQGLINISTFSWQAFCAVWSLVISRKLKHSWQINYLVHWWQERIDWWAQPHQGPWRTQVTTKLNDRKSIFRKEKPLNNIKTSEGHCSDVKRVCM